ncbi:hypothetical protein GGR56DRAFT_675286 [Xylariaceae sp. FL0804]|nr:hypothetical protein GGR56DRAFT_675286 [Xylariaceae sp. FL0804]
MASSTALAKALLALYIIFALPAAFVLVKHGFRHCLGWLYLFAFCTLKIVASALQLSDPASSSASIVSNIGLSPLLLAAAGLLHESRAYLSVGFRRPLETIWTVFFHLFVSTALALVAAGASGAFKESQDAAAAGDDPTTAAAAAAEANDETLVKVGIVLLLLGWVTICALAVLTLLAVSGSSSSSYPHSSESGSRIAGRRLLAAVLAAAPFLGVRLLAGLVYFFARVASLDPASGGGSVGARVGLESLEELITMVIFVVAGVLTRHARRGRARDAAGR